MPSTVRACLAVLLGLSAAVAGAAELPKMAFNEVKEIAPGVFFRYSSISATDDKVPFGGSNNIWVVFEDYVVVIDANFPKEAGDVIAAIRKTTNKPIRYVLDTHHHGDHAYGNDVFAREGASIISSAHCARIMRQSGAEEFKKAGEGPTGRKDIRESAFKAPTVVFDDKLVLDDGKQRIEFLFLGHAHTAGDAVAYLPRHRILCTGDACLNGAYNYTGHSDTASWIRVMERAKELDVDIVCPGHGPLAGKDLLDRQKRYFVELRQQVQKGLNAGKSLEEIQESIDMPWYKEWTGVEAKSRKENIEHVYGELTGRVLAWDLLEELGLEEGPSPTKDSPGWSKPKRIVVPNLMPARLKELKRVAPEVEFVPVKTVEEAAKEVGDADAVVGFGTPEVIKAGGKLRWAHAETWDNDKRSAAKKETVLTDTAGLAAVQTAEQALGLLASVSPRPLAGQSLLHFPGNRALETALAQRARALGLRVVVAGSVEKFKDLLPAADLVVLTGGAANLVGASELKTMKDGTCLVSTSGRAVDLDALGRALAEKHLAAAGLALPEAELPAKSHPLRGLNNVLIAPRAGRSVEAQEREWRLLRENVRRFVAGEKLLSVVAGGS
jgi:cyclase